MTVMEVYTDCCYLDEHGHWPGMVVPRWATDLRDELGVSVGYEASKGVRYEALKREIARMLADGRKGETR